MEKGGSRARKREELTALVSIYYPGSAAAAARDGHVICRPCSRFVSRPAAFSGVTNIFPSIASLSGLVLLKTEGNLGRKKIHSRVQTEASLGT